ncbi:hypothetical protein HKD37_17G048525 [Glycine soja]
MDKDQWMHDSIMSEEVDMNEQNEDEAGVKSEHVFPIHDDVLNWAQAVTYEIDSVAVIIRPDTNIGMRGRTSFVLIGCERSGQYKTKKKDLVRTDTDSRKCGCPFKLCGKLVVGGEGWMIKLMCGSHNHELVKSLVGNSYVGRLKMDEKIIIDDMTKSMVKSRNILLTLKEHNTNSYITIKQVYNARNAQRSSIRGSNIETQQLMKFLERDRYIHWHRLKDGDVVRQAPVITNGVILITYKTNRYKLLLLDFVGVTPTGMTFSNGFSYMEGEHLNNVVWALERLDVIPGVIVTNRDLALMNAMKTIFPKCINLLYRFHIDKNVKAKCKSLVDKKNA